MSTVRMEPRAVFQLQVEAQYSFESRMNRDGHGFLEKEKAWGPRAYVRSLRTVEERACYVFFEDDNPNRLALAKYNYNGVVV